MTGPLPLAPFRHSTLFYLILFQSHDRVVCWQDPVGCRSLQRQAMACCIPHEASGHGLFVHTVYKQQPRVVWTSSGGQDAQERAISVDKAHKNVNIGSGLDSRSFAARLGEEHRLGARRHSRVRASLDRLDRLERNMPLPAAIDVRTLSHQASCDLELCL